MWEGRFAMMSSGRFTGNSRIAVLNLALARLRFLLFEIRVTNQALALPLTSSSLTFLQKSWKNIVIERFIVDVFGKISENIVIERVIVDVFGKISENIVIERVIVDVFGKISENIVIEREMFGSLVKDSKK